MIDALAFASCIEFNIRARRRCFWSSLMKYGSYACLVAIGTLAALSTQVACSSGADDAVHGKVVLIGRGTHALTSADLLAANGTYGAGCNERASGSWSVAIDPLTPVDDLDNAPLSVVLKDPDCALTLTELVTTGGPLTAVQPIALTGSYKMAASSFDSPIAFYANAKLSAVTFLADFVLTVLYSDDANLVTGDVTATFAVAEASFEAESVPAPDYTLDPSAFSVLTDVDDIVQTATGTVGLTVGATAGQFYVVLDPVTPIANTYLAIDTAYKAVMTPTAVGAIPAAAFTLGGEDLTGDTVVRTLIISNTISGVTSYQRFVITFHEPVSI